MPLRHLTCPRAEFTLESLAPGSTTAEAPRGPLAFYHSYKNLISFMRFWVGRQARPDYEHRYYLLPFKANPTLKGVSLDTANPNAVLYGGRSTGKSWDLEGQMAHAIFDNPYGSLGDIREREVLITALREVHVEQRCEPIYDWFTSGKIPLWQKFIRVARRRPYELRAVNGSIFWGLPVGNDPTAKNLEGPHPWWRAIEEASHFPREAWEKFQNTAHEKGFVDRFVGVCDGRVDMPYYEIDTGIYMRYRNSQYHVPQLLNPHWDQVRKQERVSLLKGEDSDAYLQQVKAEHGSPAEGVWDLRTLQHCIIPGLAYREIIITPLDLLREGIIAEAALAFRIRSMLEGLLRPNPDKFAQYFIIKDPGYTQQGEIVVFAQLADSRTPELPGGKWRILNRVLLRNRVIQNHATWILHEVAQIFPEARLGIDATGEAGKGIANTLMDRTDSRFNHFGYSDRFYLYEGQKTVVTGHEKNAEGEEVEVKEKVKLFATTRLRDWFAYKGFEVSFDVQDFIAAFNSEKGVVSRDGNWTIETPADVHLTDVFRVFYAAWFAAFGTVDAPSETQHVWVEPMYVDAPMLQGIRL